MPRSYSFDHYQVPKRDEPAPQDKHPVGQHEEPASATGLHYGKRFAQTEAILHERQRHPKRSRAPQQSPEARAGAVPIGGLPPTPEAPVEQTAQARVGEPSALLEDAAQIFSRLLHAVGDLGAATRQLLRLPGDVARLIASRRNVPQRS